jgi:hypothetical protein
MLALQGRAEIQPPKAFPSLARIGLSAVGVKWGVGLRYGQSATSPALRPSGDVQQRLQLFFPVCQLVVVHEQPRLHALFVLLPV